MQMEMAGPCQSAWGSTSSSALHCHRILGSCAAEISIAERCQGQTMAQSTSARNSITAGDVLARADSSIGIVLPGCMGLSRVGKRATEFYSPLP